VIYWSAERSDQKVRLTLKKRTMPVMTRTITPETMAILTIFDVW